MLRFNLITLESPCVQDNNSDKDVLVELLFTYMTQSYAGLPVPDGVVRY